ncbi:MAG: bacterial Ig-like domain-containing protein [Oscillospiraceae bacterium]|jgi:hypothetical protein|nr:bacterial Ig-like domain-containing protein [Oscillospiraceae bacterium]
MRTIQILVISLFLVVAIAFSAYLVYDYTQVDHNPPVIISDGIALQVSASATDEELCAGLTALDDVDGDITDRIIVRSVSHLVGSNTAAISYVVFDANTNPATFSRTVYYTDYYKPRFSLSAPLIYNVGTTVTLLDRLHAYDAVDGDISGKLRITELTLSNTVEGEYTIRVQVTNDSGDTSSIPLTVTIRNSTSRHPQIKLSEYLVYITDKRLETEDFREFITSAFESKNGKEIDPKDIEITGEVDYTRSGVYDITFSYTNSENLSYSVILTVVLE